MENSAGKFINCLMKSYIVMENENPLNSRICWGVTYKTELMSNLQDSHFQDINSQSDSTLCSQFRGIATTDAGRYICVARNSGGTTRAVAEVVVNGES